MEKYFFSYKMEPQWFRFVGTDFLLSQPINKSKVEINIIKKLRAFRLQADKESFMYLIREGDLFVEGWAYEDKSKQCPGTLLISGS